MLRFGALIYASWFMIMSAIKSVGVLLAPCFIPVRAHSLGCAGIAQLMMLLVAVGAFLGEAAEGQTPGDASKAEFLAEYGPALETLEERCSNLTVRLRVERKVHPAEITYYIKDDAFQNIARYSPEKPPPSGFEKVYSASPGTAFYVTSGSYGGPYILRGAGDDLREGIIQRHGALDKWMALPVTQIHLHAMRQLIDGSNAQLISVKRLQENAEDVVEAEFFLQYYREGEAPPDGVAKGSGVLITIRFFPKRSWVIKGYVIKGDPLPAGEGRSQQTTRTVTLNYDDPPSTDPLFPRRIDYLMVNRLSDGEIIRDQQTIFVESVITGDVSDEQFTLPHFGLPDLQKEDGGGFFAWFVAVNVVIFAACLAYLLLKRRSAQRQLH
ncbi:MAG: hypothetical protein M3552_09625 [Planctomycetota bacterium]|nr:hypothetical protein [Planctomycetota bacterium]